MLGSETKPSVGATSTTEEQKEYKRIVKANDDGYSHLLLSVLSEKDIKAVAEATTSDFQSGCLKTAWEAIQSNYKPKTGRSKNELIRKFYNTFMNDMRTCVENKQGMQW